MSQPKKQVRTLHERLKIVEEVEKNPGEKRVDIAKRLGLAPSTLNSIFAKKDEIREQAEKCGNASKKRKIGRESTFAELERVLFSWYQQARASNIPIDGTILRGKAKMIAAQLNIENFTASNGWIARFKDRHGLVYKKLVGESAAVDSESTEAWLERLPSLLEGYEQRDIYNADETGLFYNVLPDRTLALKGESCHGGKNCKDRL
jgi:AcrR family transcriptional regulator